MKGVLALTFFLHWHVASACNGKCIVDGPYNAASQPRWLADLKADRDNTLKTINYTGGVFDKVQWTQSAWIQPQMHPYDRYFYDPVTHNYTVNRFLADLKKRYGGVDAILMWPTYTNIGTDDRNQFDLFRTMPGGLDGVKNVVSELHANGVRVLWPYNPWDTGSHREPLDDAHTFAKLLKETGSDGFNGDTMGSIPKNFWDAAVEANYPLAFEPEGGGSDDELNWATMGWGYWSYPTIPVVDRFKFLTRGKFMTNVCDRWAKTKTDNLQMAWFNGDGYESWENVWGTWNGITPYDGEAIRRVATMLRYLGKAGFLHSPDWEPHARDVWQENVFASKWTIVNGGTIATAWTIVNRGGINLTAGLMVSANKHYYDCYHGVELKAGQGPQPTQNGSYPPPSQGPNVTFSLEAHGYGCILETDTSAGSELSDFLSTMKELSQISLYSFSATWEYLPQKIIDIPKTKAASSAPNGMVLIPKNNFNFISKGVMIEGDDAHGVDIQFPWEDHPMREHSHTLAVGPFYIDKYPVTIANYSTYLKATGFTPADTYRWLKNWNGSTDPPASLLDVPVTYVSLEEARSYCKWAGGRLPHMYEWQYAAQGTDGRTYPWGNEDDQSRYPEQHSGTTFLGPEKVTTYGSRGDSPFGVSDLVGNVWQYTDEFQDDHTRAVILMGGSNYRPDGSSWYLPQAKPLNQHEKYFLMDDRYERAGTIGFRCVVDAPEQDIKEIVI